jgi:GTP cyclohydrolase IA
MRNISLAEFQIQVMKLAEKIPTDKYSSLYGVPSGGVPVAMELSRYTGIPLQESNFFDGEPDQHCLVVDDLIDSGATRAKYPENDFAVLFCKGEPPFSERETFIQQYEKADMWIHFFWEKSTGGIEDNVTRMMQYIGDDPTREGLLETPARVVKSWSELFSGYKGDPASLVKTFDSDGYNEIVVLKNIEFYSTCEHHILPFYGKASVAYIPNKRVIGISKLARLLDMYSRRLQIQERIGEQVTSILMHELQAIGAACVIEASHFCMRARGVAKQNSVMVTSSLKGVFLEESTKGLAARNELMKLIND